MNRCSKCGGVIGMNMDGKPICVCEVMTEKKMCTKCKEFKAVICFSRHAGHRSGLQSRCKTCQKQDSKEYCNSEQGNKVRTQYRKEHLKESKINLKKYRSTIYGYLRIRWCDIISRCNNPKDKAFRYYGRRGIKCLFKSFPDFYEYITKELKYDTKNKLVGLHIDRIDNDGNYERENLRIVTPTVNRSNRSDSKR